MVKKIIETSDGLNVFEDITLILTENCNFSCKYCPLIKKNKFLNYNYVKNTLEELIKYLVKVNPIIYITFFGGEPLLNSSFIFDFINSLRISFLEKNYNSKFIVKLCTNLYTYNDFLFNLFKKTKLEFADRFFFKIDVSLDLLSEFHNKNRVLKGGEGSYCNVLSNYTRLYNKYGDLFFIGFNSVLGIDVLFPQDIGNILSKIKQFLYQQNYDFLFLMPEMLTIKKLENLKGNLNNLLKNYKNFLFNFSKLILFDNNLRDKVPNFSVEQDITLPPIGPTISPDYKIYLTRDYIFSMDYKNRIKPFGKLTKDNVVQSLKFINKIGIDRLSHFYLRQYLGDTYCYNKQIIDIFNQYFGSS